MSKKNILVLGNRNRESIRDMMTAVSKEPDAQDVGTSGTDDTITISNPDYNPNKILPDSTAFLRNFKNKKT